MAVQATFSSASFLDQISIILVSTSHPGNIGSVARAMKTMGLSRLILVSPRCNPLDDTAVAQASGAEDILQKAILFNDLKSGLANQHQCIALSARRRSLPWPLLSARQFAQQLEKQWRHETDPQLSMAFIFGREDRGLTNDELSLCHLHLNIETDNTFSSLNLAAAVQVIAYEIRQAWIAVFQDTPKVLSENSLPELAMQNARWDVPLAEHHEIEGLIDHTIETLSQLRFYQPGQSGLLLLRLRRLFYRTPLDRMEINILRGILRQMQQHLHAQSAPSEHSADHRAIQ